MSPEQVAVALELRSARKGLKKSHQSQFALYAARARLAMAIKDLNRALGRERPERVSMFHRRQAG